MRMIDDCRYHLVTAGFAMPDADELRRISMTLHRWHEMECGDGNNYGSWAIVRGSKAKRVFKRDPETQAPAWEGGEFIHDDDGKPYLEHHHYEHGKGKDYVTYSPMPDRERGALKRLAKIMAKYPEHWAYVQGDPRGCALYVGKISDLPADAVGPDHPMGTPLDLSSNYTRGIAVHK